MKSDKKDKKVPNSKKEHNNNSIPSKNKEAHSTNSIATSPKAPFEWSMKNPKLRAAIPLLVFVVVFLLVWKDPEVRAIDPWYEAYMLVDSGAKSQDPAAKAELINRGGQQLKELTQKYPYHAKIHLLLGAYYNVKKQWDSAITEEKQCISLGAGSVMNPVEQDAARQMLVAVLNKTGMQMSLNDYTSTRETLYDAMRYIPKSAELFNQVALMYHRKQNIDSAAVYYHKALELAPNLEGALKNLTTIHFQLAAEALSKGDIKRALYVYQKALEFNPRNAEIYNNLGVVFMQVKDYESAIRHYSKCLELDPKFTFAAKGLVAAYQRKGDTETAGIIARKYGVSE